ncbi:MAG: cyclic nucleotide-binding domain-containing protein, partial [Verrucomicrobiota bacterium]
YEDGDIICHEESATYEVFVLLKGRVDIIRYGRLLKVEGDEGAVVGEVAGLIGRERTATLMASGETIVAVLTVADLEQAARHLPALATRVMKTLALRLYERDNLAEPPGDESG